MTLLDVTKEIQAALTSLRRGQAYIADEIARLESFLATTSSAQPEPKRRGRPPKPQQAASAAPSPAPVKRGPGRPRKARAAAAASDPASPAQAKKKSRSWTPAQREAARKRMAAYWAKRKKS